MRDLYSIFHGIIHSIIHSIFHGRVCDRICGTFHGRIALVVAFAFLTALAIPVIASAQWPSTHLIERADASFYPNGSLVSGISAIGYAEVDVGNTQDVLQYIRLNLSGTANTDLLSTTCSRNVASSPNSGDRTRIFVNTTRSSSDFSYAILNQSILSIIYLSINHSNSLGGLDLLPDSESVMDFNLSINSSSDISGAEFYLRVATNTMGSNDSMNLSNASASEGSASVQDSDSDVQYDTLYWTGDLYKWRPVYVAFEGRTRPRANFDYSNLLVDIGAGRETAVNKTISGTFTGLDISDRFSRGSVRQGVELLMENPPIVKGYIRNLANFLDYTIHGWAIYRVGELDSPLLNATNETTLSPGQSFYTDWYSSAGGKDYYTAEFDWEIEWDLPESSVSSLTKSTLELPELYVMDINPYGDIINTTANTLSGIRVSMQESFKHVGHDSLESNNLMAVLVPAAGFSIPNSSIRVFYSNESVGGERYEITGQVSITASGGNMTISMTNLTAIVGRTLKENEDIIIIHSEWGPPSRQTRTYRFTTHFTAITASGTPVTKIFEKGKTIPGVVPAEPGQPGGGPGGAGAALNFADLVKDEAEISLISGNMAEVRVAVRVYDTGTSGIKKINGTVFIPEDSEIIMSSISLMVYDQSTNQWQRLEDGSDFVLDDEGVKGVGDKQYRTFSITKKQGTFDFYNNDMIELSYRVNLPFGTHELLTVFSGYDTYQDRYIFEEIFLPIRVYEDIILEDLVITEGDFEQSDAFVGRSVIWLKRIEVYNPLASSRKKTFEVEVFPDILNAYVIVNETESTLGLKKSNISYVVWEDIIKPQETKVYYVKTITPPVIDTEEELDVLMAEENRTIFLLNTTLKNTAAENYTRLFLGLPLQTGKIINISDESGSLLHAENGEGGIYIEIPWMSGNAEKNVITVYAEIPPTLIIKPDRKNYMPPELLVNLTTIVVPNEIMESMNLEVEVISAKPRMKTVYINLVPLGTLNPGEAEKLYDDFMLSFSPPGEYLARARLKKDFSTVLYDDDVFYFTTTGQEIYVVDFTWILIVAAAIILLIVIRRHRRVSLKHDLETMKKRVKKLGKGKEGHAAGGNRIESMRQRLEKLKEKKDKDEDKNE